MPVNVRKKENRNPETQLITSFKKVLEQEDVCGAFSIRECMGANCKSKTMADIEFVARDGRLFAIEAKRHHSSDSHNSAHKLFGELLKECGRDRNGQEIVLGVLIPKNEYAGKSGVDFYRNKFRLIPRDKFLGFGDLVRARYIFVSDVNGSSVDVYTWQGFYDEQEPQHSFEARPH